MPPDDSLSLDWTNQDSAGEIEPTTIPSALGRRLLLFEFLVLIEYWIAPLFLAITNYAGVWSDVGFLLFALFVGTVIRFVLIPLVPRLRAALSVSPRGWIFHGIWVGSLVGALFATFSLQLVSGGPNPSGSAIEIGQTTVYSPFGAWPSLTVYLVPWHLYGTFDVELLAVLGLISILGASAIVLGLERSAQSCATAPERSTDWRNRLTEAAVWSPLGLITGCSSCVPLYLSVAGLAAPSIVAVGYSAVPLVPWIGLAGLLYLASFGIAIRLIQRATRGADPVPQEQQHP